MIESNFQNTSLQGADFSHSILHRMNFRNTDLRGTSFRNTQLQGADLSGANIINIHLSEADITDTIFPLWQLCLPSGKFIAWKQGKDKHLIKLEILECAQRVSLLGQYQCRSDQAWVLAIWNMFGEPVGEYPALFYTKFKYQVGTLAKCKKFKPDIRRHCASGIHFFITNPGN